MRKLAKKTVVSLVVLSIFILVPNSKSSADEPLKLTLGGGVVGGFWSMIGEAIGTTVRKAYPGSSFSYEPGSGLGNIEKVTQKKVEFAIAYSAECTLGLNGKPPFQKKYHNLRAIFTCIPNTIFHVAATRDFKTKYGVEYFSDIAKKKVPIRIAVNQKGNINEAVYRTVFEAIGLTYKDIESWGGEIYFQPRPRSVDLIKNRRCDAMGAGTFIPDSKILDVGISRPMGMLYLDDFVVEHMIKIWGEKKVVVPPGGYEFQEKPYHSMYMKTLVICDESLPQEIAYKIAKSVHANFDILRSIHKMMKKNNLRDMVNDTSPLKLHPGALKYYREVGLIQ